MASARDLCEFTREDSHKSSCSAARDRPERASAGERPTFGLAGEPADSQQQQLDSHNRSLASISLARAKATAQCGCAPAPAPSLLLHLASLCAPLASLCALPPPPPPQVSSYLRLARHWEKPRRGERYLACCCSTRESILRKTPARSCWRSYCAPL